MSTAATSAPSQIEIIQPDNNKANFILFPTRMNLTKENETASKRGVSSSQSHYTKIYEKIQNIHMSKERQGALQTASQQQLQQQLAAAPNHQQCEQQSQQQRSQYKQSDSGTSGLSDSVKMSDSYTHQRNNQRYFAAPSSSTSTHCFQQYQQQPSNAKSLCGNSGAAVLPRVLNQQQQSMKELMVKKRSVSSQPQLCIKDQGQISTTSTASSSHNNISSTNTNNENNSLISYNSLLRSSLKFNKSAFSDQNDSNASNSALSRQKYLNSQKQQPYFSQNENDIIKCEQSSAHPQNNTMQHLTSNTFQISNNSSSSLTFIDNSPVKNTSNAESNPPLITYQRRANSSSSKNIRILMNPLENTKRLMRNSDTFSNYHSSQASSQTQQQPLIKERRIIRVNSILKKRNIDQDQESPYLQQNLNSLATHESFEENNTSQVIAKDCSGPVPFISGLDMCEINSSSQGLKNESNFSTNYVDYSNKCDQITRKRCNSASPKKCVKFSENVQVCNLHTSTKTHYKLSQREMKQELIQQCSQFRKDLRSIRQQYQYQSQQQQKMKQEQLMFHLQELITLSQQHQHKGIAQLNGNKSEVNLSKIAPSVPIKQYTKFKILSKLDKSQEQEKYLQKIEQIDKQYKQNLALKLQTTYAIKFYNSKQQQHYQPQQQLQPHHLIQQQQQQMQQYHQQQTDQQQKQKQMKTNPNLFNNSLLKNLISQ